MTLLERLAPHLSGWQLAVVALSTALGGVSLALPRPVSPRELPLPTVDRAEQGESDARARAMILTAARSPLPFLVRAAGEAFRRFGDAEAKGDDAEAYAQHRALRARVSAAHKEHGDGPLLALRAVQASLFVQAVRERNIPELHQLGGKFFGVGDAAAATRTAELTDDELGALFTMRWLKLANLLGTRPFSPTLNEWRLYYRTLLAHAELASATLALDPGARALALARAIDALAKIDPDYPKLLALGVVELWMGHDDDAEDSLAAYLRAQPSGPWRLRAQNYLLAARRRVPAEDAP